MTLAMESTANPYSAPTAASNTGHGTVTFDESGEIAEVRFDATLDDVVAYLVRAQSKTPRALRVIRRTQIGSGIILLLFAWIVWVVPVRESGRSLSLTSLAIGGAIIALVTLLFPSYFRWAIAKQSERALAGGSNLGLVGPRRMQISPSHFLIEAPLFDARIRWQAIERIEDDADGVYVYTSNISAHSIPRRVFASTEDLDRFVALARHHQERAAH